MSFQISEIKIDVWAPEALFPTCNCLAGARYQSRIDTSLKGFHENRTGGIATANLHAPTKGWFTASPIIALIARASRPTNVPRSGNGELYGDLDGQECANTAVLSHNVFSAFIIDSVLTWEGASHLLHQI
jgi:hypothetical protein